MSRTFPSTGIMSKPASSHWPSLQPLVGLTTIVIHPLMVLTTIGGSLQPSLYPLVVLTTIGGSELNIELLRFNKLSLIVGFMDSWWIPSIIISVLKHLAFLRLRQLCSPHLQRPPVLPPLRDHRDSFHALCPRRCWRHHGWTAPGDLDLHIM